MERKVGEIFEYEGKKIEVKVASSGKCDGCFSNGKCTFKSRKLSGECVGDWRNDRKSVVFMEVQEQPKEIEEIKELKIDEIFEYQGKKLKVVETKEGLCFGCYFFDGENCQRIEQEGGECSNSKRADHKPVIFVEVNKEQHQNEQPYKLNLCEILKNCPKGEKFWSPMLGNVKFNSIDYEWQRVYVISETGANWHLNSDATITLDYVTSAEIMLYPSREQRDWSKVKYEPREKKFNPNTLKPFDKIITRIDENGFWCCELFSFIEEGTNLVKGCGGYYKYCVPYNDDTKHLVGTTDEAPDFYKYWED